jgi:hypothetical protein
MDNHNYSAQQYILPNQDTVSVNPIYGGPDSLHHWPLGGMVNRTNLREYEQPLIARQPPSGPPCTTSISAPGVVATEGSFFPGMGSLASSLPTHNSNERQLPNPKPSTIQPVDSGSGVSSLPGPISAEAHLSQVPWIAERVNCGGCTPPANALPSTNVSLVSAASSKSSSSPPELQNDAPFGYTQIPPSPQKVCSAAVPADYQAPTGYSVGGGETALMPTGGFQAAQPDATRSVGLRSHDQNTGSYHYGVERNKGKSAPSASEASLVSRRSYTQLPQGPQSIPSAGGRRGSTDSSPRGSLRMSNLGAAASRH